MAFHGDSIFWVEVHKIVANPFQPRREFDESKLNELAESVRMYGILQPLTVTRKEIERDDGAFYTEYELIAGERRLRAARLAGLAQVPVIIREGENNEQEKLELAIIENLQREDLNAVDRALAFKQLAEQFNLSHAKVAAKVGRSREYVSNTLRLLLLPEHMLDALKRGEISEGHARTLLMLSDKPEELETVFREIILKKISVREVERLARKIANDKVRAQKYKDVDPELIEYEKKFTDTLGTRVQIAKTEFGGRLTIDYFSEEDLHNLLAMMRAEEADKRAISTPEGLSYGSGGAGADHSAALDALQSHTPLATHHAHANEEVDERDSHPPSHADETEQQDTQPPTPTTPDETPHEASEASEQTPTTETTTHQGASKLGGSMQDASHIASTEQTEEPEDQSQETEATSDDDTASHAETAPKQEEQRDESELYSIKNFTV